MIGAEDLESLKADVRLKLRAARRAAALDVAGAGPKLAAVFPFALIGPGVVAGYWPLGSEIDPRPLMERLSHAGAVLALPRVPRRDGFAELRAWAWGAPLKPDAFGMLAPPAEAALVEAPRLILCPLLAFDRAGGRLGQGGGHYDRLLARLKGAGTVAVGLAYSAQELPEAPMAAHDQRLDWIVTEREAIEVAANENKA